MDNVVHIYSGAGSASAAEVYSRHLHRPTEHDLEGELKWPLIKPSCMTDALITKSIKLLILSQCMCSVLNYLKLNDEFIYFSTLKLPFEIGLKKGIMIWRHGGGGQIKTI